MTHVSKFERPRQLVDVPALLDALGIVVVKRERRSLFALCPFHADTTPNSWSIIDDVSSSRHGFHYCFSCQEGGGPLALLKRVRGIGSTADALEWMKIGALERPAPLEIDVVVGTYSAGAKLGMRVPSDVKVRPFEEWPSGAARYLVERGITESQVVRFDLGFALEGRLKGRIIFPMKNRDGRVVSYTARDWTGQQKRYLEPQASEGAVKGAIFGEHLWNWGPSTTRILIAAEGCPDALALDRVVMKLDNHPLYDVCALHGSSFHPQQAAKFARYKTIVVATDPDSAGDRVAEDIDEQLSRYCRVVRARPPEKQDCGSMDPDELFWMIAGALDNG